MLPECLYVRVIAIGFPSDISLCWRRWIDGLFLMTYITGSKICYVQITRTVRSSMLERHPGIVIWSSLVVSLQQLNCGHVSHDNVIIKFDVMIPACDTVHCLEWRVLKCRGKKLLTHSLTPRWTDAAYICSRLGINKQPETESFQIPREIIKLSSEQRH